MSLLKALRNPMSAYSFERLEQDFLFVIEDAGDKLDRDDVVQLLAIYGEYGAAYMTIAASTLSEPTGASQAMKFMNSYIAEGCREAGLHYFNKENAFSMVDKVVQASLDQARCITFAEVDAFIQEIEDSYIEEAEETDEE